MHLQNNNRYSPTDHTPKKRPNSNAPAHIERARLASLQNEQAPLFRFPRELRDLTYEYALGSQDISFHYRALNSIAHITAGPRYNGKGLPIWILSSRTFLSPAVDAV
ncbi:hypothetical protein EJ02DRAFT_50842 [Clathrospora elynae]|uniref:Uncharacterized protein n=1 Tax=Clathrospora elynae TaxID=706981 RepID=A0A6A5SDB8_9PLEO|nr:hypothetical protein EJ02DRAFT_50842 [Clathrospora elynae]